MTFQEFSKSYLNILMKPLSQHFALSASEVFPVLFTLNWNYSEFAILPFASSLQ